MKGSFSDRIKNLRNSRHLSRKELAEMLWVTPHMVECWEKGVAAPDSMDLIEMSYIFGVNYTDIVGDDFERFSKLPVLQEDLPEIVTGKPERNKASIISATLWSTAALCNLLASAASKNPVMLTTMIIDLVLATNYFANYMNSSEEK